MATITTINENDFPVDSRTVINDNFSNLNTDKAELASPTFTGTPAAPTPSASDNSTKLATTAYVDAQIPLVASVLAIETTSGATHSLTTTATQKVIVWVKGTQSGAPSPTVSLKYNGITKDSYVCSGTQNNSMYYAFALMYTETPGAGTQDITVTTSAGSLTDLKIIVMKIG